jgi:hypothetical protein
MTPPLNIEIIYVQVVFIGIGLDKQLIAEKLNAALLTAEESNALGGVEGWRKLEDVILDGNCAEDFFDVKYVY